MRLFLLLTAHGTGVQGVHIGSSSERLAAWADHQKRAVLNHFRAFLAADMCGWRQF